MTYSFETLYKLLFDAYFDAKAGQGLKKTALDFEENEEKYIWDLAKDIYNRTYKPRPQTVFMIEDPICHTKREVFAPEFRDRIVSHFIFNLINPIFDPTFIYDSYSCRKGRGTSFGIDRFEHHVRSVSNNWKRQAYCLSLDVSGYFIHIDRKKLYKIVKNTLDSYRYKNLGLSIFSFKQFLYEVLGICLNDIHNEITFIDIIDFDLIDYLLQTVLFRDPIKGVKRRSSRHKWGDYPEDKSMFNAPAGIGLTIGDVLSQLFSNIYLNCLDQFIKRELNAEHYGRYVDDAYIMSEDKAYLKDCTDKIEKFLYETLGLHLSFKKVKISSTSEPLYFLGCKFLPFCRFLKHGTIARFKNKIYEIEQVLETADPELITPDFLDYVCSSVNSYLGLFSRFKTYKLWTNVFQRVGPEFLKFFSPELVHDDPNQFDLLLQSTSNKSNKYTVRNRYKIVPNENNPEYNLYHYGIS